MQEIEVAFERDRMTDNVGLPLLREASWLARGTNRLADYISEGRNLRLVVNVKEGMIGQLVHGYAKGQERLQ